VPDSTDSEPVHKKQRAALDTFLGVHDESPVKKTMCRIWAESHQKTRSYYIEKGSKGFHSLCSTLAPGQEQELMASIIQSANFRNACGINKDDKIPDSDLLKCLADVYGTADTPRMKMKILSLMAPYFEFYIIEDIIPGISRFKYNEAKKYASLSVPCAGLTEKKVVSHRRSIDDKLLDHFIGYLLSSQVTIDCPYGTKTYTVETGELITVPLIIMKHHYAQTVRQYMSYCSEIGLECCSERTYMRILEDIGPRVRKSMQGLDNYLADGITGFETLKKYASSLFRGEDGVLRSLDRAKNYLKCDYKVRLFLGSIPYFYI
jgi:hypothetical protein